MANAGDPGSIPGLGRSAGEGIGYPFQFLGIPCGSVGKESACNAGDLDSVPGLVRSPGEGNGYPPQYSGLEKSMDYIYSPWGRKEPDRTERLSLKSWAEILGACHLLLKMLVNRGEVGSHFCLSLLVESNFMVICYLQFLSSEYV